MLKQNNMTYENIIETLMFGYRKKISENREPKTVTISLDAYKTVIENNPIRGLVSINQRTYIKIYGLNCIESHSLIGLEMIFSEDVIAQELN